MVGFPREGHILPSIPIAFCWCFLIVLCNYPSNNNCAQSVPHSIEQPSSFIYSEADKAKHGESSNSWDGVLLEASHKWDSQVLERNQVKKHRSSYGTEAKRSEDGPGENGAYGAIGGSIEGVRAARSSGSRSWLRPKEGWTIRTTELLELWWQGPPLSWAPICLTISHMRKAS